ncbi:hypothetical protein [Cyanobium sp. NIES-981]|uniref:hypothetical protein n=1 Tax=Cyanobium sp. NIES-981 TaxID=1851505 RepID=UPI0007DCD3C1|nr:hypothetical protein [Cyanobium sp. NIES-981]SBO43171.1 conserved protein of unknown function [Cyanobium sp. NIES-981]
MIRRTPTPTSRSAAAVPSDWLPPIPGLRRTDPEHRYWLGDHLFAVSVTGVVGSSKSDWAMARIEATRHIWEPRGHTVHLALEALLHSRFHPLPQHQQQANERLQHLRSGDYQDWIEPLLAHMHWQQVTVIASERPTCCLIRNLAGTYDTGYIQHAGGLRVLADLKTLSRPGSGSYCTRAQLGGYMALEATWGVHYDGGQTIWARPGETRFSPLYSREECLAAWAAAWAGYVSRFRHW